MKTLQSYFTLLFVLVVTFFFLGCKPFDKKKLYGTWEESGSGHSTFIFSKQGEFQINYDSEEEMDRGTFTLDKDKIQLKSEVFHTNDSYTIISLEENELTISLNDIFEMNFIKQK